MSRQWLRDLRLERRRLCKEVAADAGITPQMYSAIETGQRSPSVSAAKRIAAALGFDWTRFFEEPEAAEDSA